MRRKKIEKNVREREERSFKYYIFLYKNDIYNIRIISYTHTLENILSFFL